MKNVIDDDNVDFIDYLSGDDNYKKDWMIVRRQIIGSISYNKSCFIGLFLSLIDDIKYLIKKYII